MIWQCVYIQSFSNHDHTFSTLSLSPSIPSSSVLFVKMFSSSSLLSLLLVAAFAVNVDASPCQRRASTSTSILNFAAKINTVGLKNVAEIDRLRVAHHRATGLLSNGTGKRDGVEGVTDPTAVQYTASVGVGSPATQCECLRSKIVQ